MLNSKKIIKSSKGILICATILSALLSFSSCVGYKNIVYKDVDETFSGDSVTKICIDLSFGNFTISTSKDDNFKIEAKDVPENFAVGVDDDTFRIDFNNKKNYDLKKLEKANIKLYVPEDVYEKIEINSGAASGSISGISGEDVDISCGKGYIDITDMNASEPVEINCGVGNIDVNDSIFDGLNLELGIGSFVYNGTINGDINIKNGIGSVTLNLENDEDEFKDKYDIDVETQNHAKITFNN